MLQAGRAHCLGLLPCLPLCCWAPLCQPHSPPGYAIQVWSTTRLHVHGMHATTQHGSWLVCGENGLVYDHMCPACSLCATEVLATLLHETMKTTPSYHARIHLPIAQVQVSAQVPTEVHMQIQTPCALPPHLEV